jgi:hypothetical protein
MTDLPFVISRRHLADVSIVSQAVGERIRVRHRWTVEMVYCMAYAPIIVDTQEGEKRGFCGVYYCGAKSVWQYPLRIQHFTDTAVGRRNHGVASALLDAQIVFGIPPSAWRLFPVSRRRGIPRTYARQRTELAQIVGEYGRTAGAGRAVVPLIRRISKVKPDPSGAFVPIDKVSTEHKEFVCSFKLQRP